MYIYIYINAILGVGVDQIWCFFVSGCLILIKVGKMTDAGTSVTPGKCSAAVILPSRIGHPGTDILGTCASMYWPKSVIWAIFLECIHHL